ncbi:MAG: hypothetical protein ACRCX2_13550 [Paraclostridium sp.]
MNIIKQVNIKIERAIDFDIDDFKKVDSNKFVLFYFDKTIGRNRYSVHTVKKSSSVEELYDTLTDNNYRGNIQLSSHGLVPLFVSNFPYPLYEVELHYVDVKEDRCIYKKLTAPLSFKLKDKEDRLCFDVSIKSYDDVTNMINDNWYSKCHKKAMKVELPLI